MGDSCGKSAANAAVHAECDPKAGFCADTTGAIAVDGTCKAWTAIGGACGDAGALCNPTSSTCNSTTQKCVALPNAGEPCASDFSGAGCVQGAFCDRSDGVGTPGRCAAQKADGAACGDDAECVSGTCVIRGDPQPGTATGTCGVTGLYDVSPRSCGFGPEGTGPEDTGIQPPAKAP